ncbi:hypothetical protein DAPPUDRAFT_249030 [Daphnia pulex]|uniref:C-type lectin domain-containing protein n=1 Tax=Daphnia pulex TaxID=6669 RepID=E9GVQ1_DAPPU|nr:hypothetical protein DAPPUDRAFT_249030 [Daphnia pulex]|eukprot:EFX76485.1 hypothetical protein DAPPUDRAFT_249030 [Daphnia pulex]
MSKRSILFSVLVCVGLVLATGIHGESVGEVDNKFLFGGISITIDKPGVNPPPTPPPTPTPTPPPTPPTPPTPTPPNPNECVTFTGGFKCYKLPTGCVCPVNTQKPWVDAFDFCKANGRSLISFKTAEKQAEFETYLPAIIAKSDNLFTTIGFWTSGTFCLETLAANVYCPSKNTWAWAATRENFGYVNWETGQPDVTMLPRTACARAVPTNKYKWDDIDCGQFLPFICE